MLKTLETLEILKTLELLKNNETNAIANQRDSTVRLIFVRPVVRLMLSLLLLLQAIGGALEGLEEQYRDLAPTLAQIDNIEENVTKLEQEVFKLDGFCKQLEQKLKSLESK